MNGSTHPYHEPRPVTYGISDPISLLTHTRKNLILNPEKHFFSSHERLGKKQQSLTGALWLCILFWSEADTPTSPFS